MNLLKKEGVNWIIILVPVIFVALNWSSFPAQVPIHFNYKGEPDDYGDKATGLLMLPIVNIFTYISLLLTSFVDPRKKNYSLFMSKFRVIRTMLHLFLSVLALLICIYSLGYNFNISDIVKYAVIGMCLVLGNYLGNIRSNYFIGIRVPWTLENETVWMLTHRLAGRVWVIASLLMLPATFLFPSQAWLFLLYVALLVLIPVIYSFIKYKQIVKQH